MRCRFPNRFRWRSAMQTQRSWYPVVLSVALGRLSPACGGDQACSSEGNVTEQDRVPTTTYRLASHGGPGTYALLVLMKDSKYHLETVAANDMGPGAGSVSEGSYQ